MTLVNFRSYKLTTEFAGGELLLGLYQWDDEMMVFIEINLSSICKHGKKVDKFLRSESVLWESSSNEESYVWCNERPLSSFIVDNIFEEQKASDFIAMELQKIQKIKDWGK